MKLNYLKICDIASLTRMSSSQGRHSTDPEEVEKLFKVMVKEYSLLPDLSGSGPISRKSGDIWEGETAPDETTVKVSLGCS
jgi:hypothetical protein